MGKLIPVVLVLAGLGLGAGGGLYLRDAPPETEVAAERPQPQNRRGIDYVRIPNQFVVPVVEGGRVGALVVLSLSVAVTAGHTETVFAREPKLRDVFLKVLFDHANTGGFRGTFTDSAVLLPLRRALREAAAEVLGDILDDVLISEIMRQDN